MNLYFILEIDQLSCIRTCLWIVWNSKDEEDKSFEAFS
jgi:hypothetical protein